MNDHPVRTTQNHQWSTTLPKWMFCQKLFLKSSLTLSGQCGIKVCPPTISDDLCLLLCLIILLVCVPASAEKPGGIPVVNVEGEQVAEMSVAALEQHDQLFHRQILQLRQQQVYAIQTTVSTIYCRRERLLLLFGGQNLFNPLAC